MRKLTMPELNRLSLTEYQEVEKLDVIIVLDNVRSLSNIGSFFRTADAFRIGEIFLCGITACPPHREIHKTALGAEESIAWSYYPTTIECVEHLRNEGYKILAIEQVEGAVMLDQFRAEEGVKYAIIFGNEVMGVGQEVVDMCDGAIEIPQFGTKHSLNVSVSGGVVLWDFFCQIGLKR